MKKIRKNGGEGTFNSVYIRGSDVKVSNFLSGWRHRAQANRRVVVVEKKVEGG